LNILIIEDERDLAEAIAAVLTKNNFNVEVAFDGEYGLDCALTGIHDVILLDIMLPKKDGLCIISELRSAGITASVLMLTARGDIRDKVIGLNSGADDYLPKPFHMEELLARINALARRKGELQFEDIIRYGDLCFNPCTITICAAGNKEIRLTRKESQLLELLYAYRDGVVSKERIIEKLWGYDSDAHDSNVESQISLLRKKLASTGTGVRISVIRGAGYCLENKKEK